MKDNRRGSEQSAGFRGGGGGEGGGTNLIEIFGYFDHAFDSDSNSDAQFLILFLIQIFWF